jgi:hypothetical protein
VCAAAEPLESQIRHAVLRDELLFIQAHLHSVQRPVSVLKLCNLSCNLLATTAALLSVAQLCQPGFAVRLHALERRALFDDGREQAINLFRLPSCLVGQILGGRSPFHSTDMRSSPE